MPEKSRRQKVAEACLWLPVYARYGGSTGDFPGGQPDYMGEEAQAYLRRNTDPCFAELAALQKEFERNFKALKQQVRAATQICEELMTLKKARAELRMSDICALETIEAEIETCLKRVETVRDSLTNPELLARWPLGRMEECIDVYVDLWRYLNDQRQVDYYRAFIQGAQAECQKITVHPIRAIDVKQEQEDLLCHLRAKRDRERREMTRADILEGFAFGWW